MSVSYIEQPLQFLKEFFNPYMVYMINMINTSSTQSKWNLDENFGLSGYFAQVGMVVKNFDFPIKARSREEQYLHVCNIKFTIQLPVFT